MEKKYKRLGIDIIVFGLGTLGSKLIMFFLIPIYTNALSSAEYGVSDLVFTMSELLRPFISLAIYNGLLRYGLSTEDDKKDVLRCSMIIFFIGSIITIVVTPLFGLYEAISEWKWYLCIYTLVVFASKIILNYLKVSNKNKLYSVLSIVQAAILALSNILLLVVFRCGIKGYLVSNILAFAFVSILAFVLGRMSHDLFASSFKADLLKKMVLYSLPFIANDISWWLIHSSDKFMLERMIGTDALGIYTAASKIPLMLTVVASIFAQAWHLSVINEYETDGNQENRYYSNIFRIFSTCVFGFAIALIAITKPFMAVYVGSDFSESWHYVPLLIIAAVFSVIATFVEAFYGALKKSTFIMKSTMVASVVNVILNYVFINICGIWGAVIGTVFAYLTLAMVRLINIRKYITIRYNIKKFVAMMVIAVLQAIFVGFDIHVLEVSLISIVAYVIVIHKDIKDIYQLLIRRIKKL